MLGRGLLRLGFGERRVGWAVGSESGCCAPGGPERSAALACGAGPERRKGWAVGVLGPGLVSLLGLDSFSNFFSYF